MLTWLGTPPTGAGARIGGSTRRAGHNPFSTGGASRGDGASPGDGKPTRDGWAATGPPALGQTPNCVHTQSRTTGRRRGRGPRASAGSAWLEPGGPNARRGPTSDRLTRVFPTTGAGRLVRRPVQSNQTEQSAEPAPVNRFHRTSNLDWGQRPPATCNQMNTEIPVAKRGRIIGALLGMANQVNWEPGMKSFPPRWPNHRPGPGPVSQRRSVRMKTRLPGWAAWSRRPEGDAQQFADPS
jgi:hypothetical protein